jgi:conjugative transfer pilus assembly protein TraH
MCRRLTPIILALLLLINLVVPASADVSQDMDNMFKNFGFSGSNVTTPHAYFSQQGGVIAGGGFVARSAVMPIHLIGFTPPSIQAGCGGINMYFGGLSFIGQDFITLLKNIGANAEGYAFQIGLEVLAPTINKEITELRNYINKLNSLATNSCDAAKEMVNWGVQNTIEASVNDCITDQMDANSGNTGYSPSDARNYCLQNAPQWKQTLYQQTASNNGAHALNPWHSPGVSTYDQLKYVQDVGGLSLSTSEQDVLISLLGTYTTRITTGANGVATPVTEWHPPTINFKDFVDGTTTANVYIPSQSSDSSSGVYDSVTTQSITTLYPAGLPGYKVYVHNVLICGDGMATTCGDTPQSGSIIEELADHRPLTASQEGFVDSSPVPIKSLVDASDKTPGMLPTAVEMTSDIIAVEMAYDLVDTYAHAVAETASKQASADPNKIIHRLAELRSQMNAQLQQEYTYLNTTMRTYELTAFWFKQVANMARGNVAQHVGATK